VRKTRRGEVSNGWIEMSTRDFLLEIGTEELPPKSLFILARALADALAVGLAGAGITHGAVAWFATPRRLATRITGLAEQQPDQVVKRQGPAVAAAFDSAGRPSKAALGFAASCGIAVEQLEQVDGPKGKVLQYVGVKRGGVTAQLMPQLITQALKELPIAKRMRWGSSTEEFVRPVHWVVMLFGHEVVDARIMGIQSGRQSRGHRFHAPGPLPIDAPSAYEEVLRTRGKVLVDAAERTAIIERGVKALAQSLGGTAVIKAELLEEVAALVEWPVPLAGRFDARYLTLPPEVPIATMQDHQRYFPVRDAGGKLMNHFITVANIESLDPSKVRDGNERVVRPRLADAAFFWETDRKRPLHERRETLRQVTFHNQLGSLFDKSARVVALASQVGAGIGADEVLVQRAGELAKCDLLTLMVGEFPELQGVMGRYYALEDGEPAEVCTAIEEHYWPRFAGDALPSSRAGLAVAIADKLDTITGIFATGQKPSGTRDPFGLRRAAVGILRILLERSLDLDLRQLVAEALRRQPLPSTPELAEEVWSYLMERLRSSYLENESSGVTTEMFDAVLGSNVGSALDIQRRLTALQGFLGLPDAAALSSANKRIANILRKAPEFPAAINAERLGTGAEQELFAKLLALEAESTPLFQKREYAAALSRLASLRQTVDAFFDDVMVMVEDAAVRNNRLALLQRVRQLFLQIADLSRLPG
jgi:glycyl-tRNA synthetase beta chain